MTQWSRQLGQLLARADEMLIYLDDFIIGVPALTSSNLANCHIVQKNADID